MRIARLFVLLAVIATASGCAVGNKYSYHNVDIALPVNGSGQVGLAVIDNREEILSGKREPDFVGVQRATLGNAWAVSTVSGNALTDDFAAALEIALTKSGYDVSVLQGISGDDAAVNAAVANAGKDKNVVLTVTDWKTDIYMNMTLFYDLVLSIVGGDGAVMASTAAKGEEKLSGASMTASGNSQTATSAMETKLGRLFNDPAIREALEQ
jgi:hypothetical protein